MLNLREIRISILYFINVLMMVLLILVIRKYHLLSGDINTAGISSIIIVIIAASIVLALIPCLVASIHHTIKAAGFNRVYYKENHYAEWNYDKKEWTNFIITNFKKNNRIEIYSFKRAAVYYGIVVLSAFSIDVIKNSDDRKHIIPYLSMILASFLMYFIPVIFKNVISMIDHIVFGNHSIILMGGTIIVNGEVFRLDVPLKKELMKKQIKDGNVEVEYAVPSRYANRYANKEHLNVKDIKRLIIPIPSGRYKEAEDYINAPFPSQCSCYKDK